MSNIKTTAENPITDAKIEIHTNTEILDIIAKMSPEELKRLGEILAVMQKYEQVLPKKQLDLQGAKLTETQNPKPEQPHNLVLKFAVKQHENKILRNLETIKNRKNKISQHENKIKSRQNKLEKTQKKITRLRGKIKQFKFSNEYLDNLKGGKFDGALNFITAQNDAAIAKIQSQIEKTVRRVLSGQNIIDNRKMKINILQEKIYVAESKNELLRDKLQKISAFDALPNAALSYFIADKLGADIPHANKIIADPEKIFTAEKTSENTKNFIADNLGADIPHTNKIIADPEKVFTAEKTSEIAEKSGENVSAEIPTNEPQPKYSDKDFDKLHAALEYNSDEVKTLARFGGATEQLQLYAQFEGINPDLAEVVPLYLEENLYVEPYRSYLEVMAKQDYLAYIADEQYEIVGEIDHLKQLKNDYGPQTLVKISELNEEIKALEQLKNDSQNPLNADEISEINDKIDDIKWDMPYTPDEIDAKIEKLSNDSILDKSTSKGLSIYDDTAYFKVIDKEDFRETRRYKFYAKAP